MMGRGKTRFDTLFLCVHLTFCSMQIVWSFSANDYIVLVMKLIDDRNGIITIQAVRNITRAEEVVPQLFLFLKFLLHDG